MLRKGDEKMQSRLLYKNTNLIRTPELTIVIPTYKRAKYVEDSIKSIICQNNESVSYEIVVINNDPESDMSDLINRFKDSNISFYSNEENYGQVGNINQGIYLAKAKYVAILHDDDFLLQNYFHVVSDLLRNDLKGNDCIITSYYQLHNGYKTDIKHKFLRGLFLYRFLYRKRLSRIRPSDCAKSLRNVYSVPTCGIILRKSAVEKFGYFKDVSGSAWDYFNFRHFNRISNISVLHEFVAVRRMYTGMSNIEKIQKEFNAEKMTMIKENDNYWIVRNLGRSMVTRTPKLQYLVAYFVSTVYFYSHNLDTDISISKKMYKKLIEEGGYKL